MIVLLIYLHIVQKWTKNQCGRLKKFKKSVHGTLNPAILRLQGVGIYGPLEQYLAENVSLQRSNYIIFGLKNIVALSANEARFFRFRVFFQACSLLNEVGDPQFFYISNITNSSTLNGKSLRKNQCWEIFCANVLKMWHLCPSMKTRLDLKIPPNHY